MVFFLGIIQVFVGVSASAVGLMLIAAPSGRLLHTPPEMLQGSPFPDYFIPGLILFTINGMGQCFAAFFTFKKKKSAPLAGAILGLGLMIWIFVQVNMIGGGHIMQYSFFFIGVVETALAFLLATFGIDRNRSHPDRSSSSSNLHTVS